MSKALLKKRMIVIRRWFLHVFLFKKPELLSWHTDQELLFDGSFCCLFPQVKNAYLVKLYLGDRFYKSYLPGEMLRIPIGIPTIFTLKVCGVYQAIRQTIHLKVQPLSYRNAGRATLLSGYIESPVTFEDIALHLPYRQPVKLSPVLKTPDLQILMPYASELEEHLQAAKNTTSFIIQQNPE